MKLTLLCLCVFGVCLQRLDFTESSGQVNDLGPSAKISRNRQRRETESSSYFYYQEPQYPRDCKEVYEQCDDQTDSGVFMIQPDGAPEPFNVHCNNSIDGGGWTGDYELRIDLVSRNGNSYFAKYDLFRISDEISKYRMADLGTYLPESTTNYDSMAYHRNMSFSTWDRENHKHSSYNCASYYHGAWWFNACYYSTSTVSTSTAMTLTRPFLGITFLVGHITSNIQK
ncbi:Fibrinogen-like protein A [Apostichopus japonicus]|uniref:Fibrinogen-like protein A n=1 Tax=Stichopus japonicus TaxID=307972 RepID=A0A2G8KIE6_STIJA|nr:Fibrinogen-like protein A [Apostichopus japonicus]